MATNGMTINGLNPLSALTADDKILVWDTGASGEPTKEITAQNMANSVKSLASLPNTTEMNAAIAQSTANTNRFMSFGSKYANESTLDEGIEQLNNNTSYVAVLSGGGGMIIGFKGTAKYQRQIKIDYWNNTILSRLKNNTDTWSSWVTIT